ncbi:MAG: type II toxin-antitoxin system PemK/MazF family toxin [Methanomicrobiales archaeon]|nr:type II toxin-antitoxin system PemK/MazF family toxin [Methanomicrobiales archaeon]
MAHFRTGDVLLAPVQMGRHITPKVRPVVVVGTGEDGVLFVCPVSSRPPSDAPAIPLGLDDFAEGGLDLFEESYILSTHICRVAVSDVIGKKGRLRPGMVDGILPE